MKGKDTRDYPYRGYPSAAGCNWLRVDFDEGGKAEYPEKNPQSQIEIDWNSAHIWSEARVEPRSKRWEARLMTASQQTFIVVGRTLVDVYLNFDIINYQCVICITRNARKSILLLAVLWKWATQGNISDHGIYWLNLHSRNHSCSADSATRPGWSRASISAWESCKTLSNQYSPFSQKRGLSFLFVSTCLNFVSLNSVFKFIYGHL